MIEFSFNHDSPFIMDVRGNPVRVEIPEDTFFQSYYAVTCFYEFRRHRSAHVAKP